MTTGDFSAGNVGFQSEYAFAPPAKDALFPEATYTLVRQTRAPFVLNTFGIAGYGEHTTETVLAMFVNGASRVSSLVRGQTLNGLQPGATYDLALFVSQWTPNRAAPATILITMDGVALTVFHDLDTAGAWVRQTTTFVAGESSGVLKIWNVGGES